MGQVIDRRNSPKVDLRYQPLSIEDDICPPVRTPTPPKTVTTDRWNQFVEHRKKRQSAEKRRQAYEMIKHETAIFDQYLADFLDNLAEEETEEHPLQKEFGFTIPEDGSEERYVERRKKYKVPWTTHTFYWILHNNIAHFLIGIFPIRPFFKFHDWTSRKMHGK